MMANREELKSILIFAGIVAAGSVVTAGSLMYSVRADQPEVEAKLDQPVRSVASVAEPAKQENPIKPADRVAKPAKDQSLTVDCSNLDKTSFKTTSDRIQLKGENCKHVATEIQNVSTGYTASMFFPKGKSFMTDFIQLKEGKNQILMAGVSGQYIELVIERTLK